MWTQETQVGVHEKSKGDVEGMQQKVEIMQQTKVK